MRQHKTGLSMQTTVNAALYQKRIGLFLHRKNRSTTTQKNNKTPCQIDTHEIRQK